jgi:TonB family protein
MKGPLARSQSWSRPRWALLVLAIFAIHVGLILAFGDRKPIVPRVPEFVPGLFMVEGREELLELQDPTLFALPHARGFSGAAWVQTTHRRPEFYRWNEPTPWLALSPRALGQAFSQFMETNAFAGFAPELKPKARQIRSRSIDPARFVTDAKSLLRVEGQLASREMLNTVSLPSWPAADLLAPSLVQVLVDASGRVVSAVLLPPGSGAAEADHYALEVAKSLRFDPVGQEGSGQPSTGWVRGRLVFQWHTAPLEKTDGPAATP